MAPNFSVDVMICVVDDAPPETMEFVAAPQISRGSCKRFIQLNNYMDWP